MAICAVSFLWKEVLLYQKPVAPLLWFWLSQCQTNDPGVVVLPRAEVSVLVPTVLSKLYHYLVEEC